MNRWLWFYAGALTGAIVAYLHVFLTDALTPPTA